MFSISSNREIFETFIKNNLTFISSWESKGLSNEVIEPPTTTDNSLAHLVISTGISTVLRFGGSRLKQDKSTFVPLNTVNIFIFFEIIKNNPISSYPTLENYLFGAVKLIKNPDIDNYNYSGYDIGCDRRGKFSFGNGFGQNVNVWGRYELFCAC